MTYVTAGGISSAINLAAYTKWSNTSLTYEFYTALTSFYNGVYAPFNDTTSGVAPLYVSVFDSGGLNNVEQSATIRAFNMYAAVSTLTFTAAGAGTNSDIGIGGFTTSYLPLNTAAYASAGNQATLGTDIGDIWISYNGGRIPSTSTDPTEYGYTVIGHEIGHVLGLKHTQDSVGTYPALTGVENTSSFSIMSYSKTVNETRYVTDLQLYDIASIQWLYGRNDDYRSLTDTYAWYNFLEDYPGGVRNRYFSIWDGGGEDRINAAADSSAPNLAAAAFIDLRPGHFSSIGNGTLVSVVNHELLSAGVQNVSIAFGTVIENATGTDHNDSIVGNVYANKINGGAGDDMLFGSGSAVREVAGREAEFGIAALLSALDTDDGDYSKIDVGTVIASTAPGESTVTDEMYGGDGNDFIASGDGPSKLYGDEGDDILVGGGGNDELIGGGGSDKIWGDGGTDTVDYSASDAAITIEFDGTGTLPAIIVKDGMGGTDTLHSVEIVKGTVLEDKVTFKGIIPDGYNLKIDANGGQPNGIKDVVDAAGSTDLAGMKIIIAPNSGGGFITSRSGTGGTITLMNFHTDIIGSGFSDAITDESDDEHSIDGGAGDDTITVAGSNATIDGGAGNDVIHLKSAAATIKFGAGGGHDVVEFDSGDGDYNIALQGLNPEDVEFIAGGRDTYSYIASTGGNITEGEDAKGFHVQFTAIKIKATGETITFLENGKNIGPDGNGSSVGYNLGSPKIKSIAFADGTIIGGIYDAVRDYWGYRDDYWGRSGRAPESYVDYVNATYLQASPVASPPPAPDQNLPGTPDDDNIMPGRGNDTVEGGAGNDVISESQGNDTYKWSVGDGDDIIWGAGPLDGFNTLELGVGILPADLQFAVSNDGAGLTITFDGQTGSITLSSALVGDGFGVDQIRFADSTIMSRADLITAASSVITAAQATVNGTASADFIFAPAGNFILNAGGGDDYIRVDGTGAGRFIFSSADGHDQINDFGFGYSRNDTLELTDANAADITLSRSGDSLIVTVISTGATVNVKAQFQEDDGEFHGINTLKFSDNTTWTRLQIRDAALGTESGSSPIAETATASVVEDGAIIRGALVATDADAGEVLSFSLDDRIDGLVLAANGSWSFDASNAAYQNLSQGEELVLTANYHVTDSAGLTSASTLTLTLTGTSTMPLVEQELVNQRLADNAAFSYDVTNSFSDPEGDTLVFTAKLDDGSELPAWLTFANGLFEGAAPTGTSDVLNIVVTASNGTMETSSVFRLHFGSDNDAPGVPTPLPDILGRINTPLDISVDSFIDPDGDATMLSATLADDSPLPGWLSFDNGRLTGTPPMSAYGDIYEIKIKATDGEDEGDSVFSLSIGRQQIFGTPDDDTLMLDTLFEVTGGLGNDWQIVAGDGGGTFYYSRGDGWDSLDQFDQGVRSDELIFIDINSDEISVVRWGDGANLYIDDYNEFWAGYQFSEDNPGGVPQGLEQVHFADGVSWDRNEIRNRADAPEILLDSSSASQLGSSVSEAFVIATGLGAGTIDDFTVTGSSHDYLQFDRSQFDSWEDLLGATTQQGSDLVIDLGGGDSVRLRDISISAFTSLNVRFHGDNTLKYSDNTTQSRLQIGDAVLETEGGTSPMAEAATASVVEDGAIIRETLAGRDAVGGIRNYSHIVAAPPSSRWARSTMPITDGRGAGGGFIAPRTIDTPGARVSIMTLLGANEPDGASVPSASSGEIDAAASRLAEAAAGVWTLLPNIRADDQHAPHERWEAIASFASPSRWAGAHSIM